MKNLNTMKKIRTIIGLIVIVPTVMFSQVTTEQIYHGAQSMALAGSNVASINNAFAVFQNPAGLSRVNQITGAVSYTQTAGLSFFPHSMAAAVLPIGQSGAGGISVENLSVSAGGALLTQETALSAHYGFYVQKDRNSTLAVGLSTKYLSVEYGKSAGISGDGSDGIDLGKSQTLGVDIGFQASLRNRHWMGVLIKNINRPKLGKTVLIDLPKTVEIGMAYSPYATVWTTFSLRRSAGHPTQYGAGLEYELIPGLTLYSGVHSNPNRLGAGFRLSVNRVHLDYGLLTHPVLSLTHQVTIGVNI